MTAFPAAGYFSDNARTNAEAVAAFDSWLAATKQLMGGLSVATFTIASGNVTPDRGNILVDTEGAAAADDLERVVPTNLPDGSLLILQAVDSARKVTVKHAAGGTGQIVLDDSADFLLGSRTMSLWLYRDGNQWRELDRSFGTQFAAWRTWLGLGDLATRTFASLQPFASADFTVTSGGKFEEAHGLGAMPMRWWATLRCVSAEAGYDIGDTLLVDGSFLSSSPRMITLYANDTVVGAQCSNAGIPLAAVSIATGASVTLTLANWRLKLFASLL